MPQQTPTPQLNSENVENAVTEFIAARDAAQAQQTNPLLEQVRESQRGNPLERDTAQRAGGATK